MAAMISVLKVSRSSNSVFMGLAELCTTKVSALWHPGDVESVLTLAAS